MFINLFNRTFVFRKRSRTTCKTHLNKVELVLKKPFQLHLRKRRVASLSFAKIFYENKQMLWSMNKYLPHINKQQPIHLRTIILQVMLMNIGTPQFYSTLLQKTFHLLIFLFSHNGENYRLSIFRKLKIKETYAKTNSKIAKSYKYIQ